MEGIEATDNTFSIQQTTPIIIIIKLELYKIVLILHLPFFKYSSNQGSRQIESFPITI